MNALLLTSGLLLYLNLPPLPQQATAEREEPAPAKRTQFADCPRWTRDKPFLLLTLGAGLSAVGDVETTQRFRQMIQARGLEPGEVNPLARPFVANRGRQYAAWNATVAGASWLGWKMKNSKRRWVRRLWPLPQAALLGVNLTATVHNLRGMRKFQRRP